MTALSSKFTPSEIEDKWYQYWESNGYFKSEPDDRESFSIVIPPPNVTGVLHMGHMLNLTIQDILIRHARLLGKNACWVPGTDHASIATEAKVVRHLREKGIKKGDLTREQFLKHAWAWTEEYGGIILQQLRRLGASCDWDRTAFTLDEVRSQGVMKAFVDLYRKGYLYRDYRIVNWDPEAKTVLSNEEVIHQEEQANLFHIKYRLEQNPEIFIIIATQRPETIMADVAVAVHPDDPRYANLVGHNVVIPLINRPVPVIADEYVDIEFGTGALKITPAHDPNDYEIGKKYNLEVIDILNEDGTLNEKAEILVGEDRFEARKKIKKLLKEADVLAQIEPYMTSIGRSERTNAVVEPRLSLQWYVNMPSLAKKALEAVETDEVAFFPNNFKNTYRHWMENIRDWCISRQLWWGHQIPAWYIEDEVFVAETAAEALDLARDATGNAGLQLSDLTQDEDALDTWFSSWLWPITVFDGFNNTEDFKYYYPTNVLVTGWDIIFLWVARMVMAGYEWYEERPFDKVYFTGMVRDKQRRKMSKSLGNSPDAIKLIEDYGADGVRYGLLASSPAGGDLLFEDKLCENGRNFCNKMWNALRLIKGWDIDSTISQPKKNTFATQWFEQKMQAVLAELNKSIHEFRLSEGLKTLYSFIWNDFFSYYLEVQKPNYGEPIDAKSLEETINFYSRLMTLLHPFMPFITEEIWHQLKDRQANDVCMLSNWPIVQTFDNAIVKQVDTLQDILTKIRDIRASHGIKAKDPLGLFIEPSTNIENLLAQPGAQETLLSMAFLTGIHVAEQEPDNAISFISGTDKFYLEINVEIDVAAECEKLTKELEHNQSFAQAIQKKLSNQNFVQNAPAVVVDKERKKLADSESRIQLLQEALGKLGCA